MKKLLIITAVLIPAVVSAVWFPYALVSSKPPPPIIPPDHITQGFETQGAGLKCYDNGESWTENNSGDNLLTNTVFVGEGSRGLTIREYSGVGPYALSPIITPALGNSYWYFTFATTTTNTQQRIVDFYSNGVDRASIWIRATGRLSLYEETDLNFGCSPAEGIPTNTMIHVWANYNLAAGTYELAFSTTSTKPSSGPKWTNATGTPIAFKINQIELKTGIASVTNYFDKIRGTNIVIGSNPP